MSRVEPDGTKTSYRRVGNQEIGKLIVTKTGDDVQIVLQDQQSFNEEYFKALTKAVAHYMMQLMGAPIR